MSTERAKRRFMYSNSSAAANFSFLDFSGMRSPPAVGRDSTPSRRLRGEGWGEGWSRRSNVAQPSDSCFRLAGGPAGHPAGRPAVGALSALVASGIRIVVLLAQT